MTGAPWGLALPNLSLTATCHFWGHYFGERGTLGWQEPLLPQRGVWGAMTPHFSPDSQEGHSLSCHGFCSPIPGLFNLVSAKLPSCHSATILSAARDHAELETEGGLAQKPGSSCTGAEAPACPQPRRLCRGECPTSVPHSSQHLHWLPQSG